MKSNLKPLIWSLTIATLSTPSLANRFFKKTDLEGQVRLGGYYVDNKQVEARVFGVTGLITADSKITDSLKVNIKAGATLEVGSNNSFIVDEYEPRRQWRLKDAYLQYNPFEFIEVK